MIPLINSNKNVFFADECVFAASSTKTGVWVPKNSTLNFKEVNRLTFNYIGVVGAINSKGETIALRVKTGAVKIPDFLAFLNQIY